MKNSIGSMVLALIAGTVIHLQAETPPALDVVVYNPAGKAVYRTATGPNGTFTTGRLEPGTHVVQFSGKGPGLRNAEYALAVYIENRNVCVAENALAGERFNGPGVAMKIDVPAGFRILGQVANGLVATHDGSRTYKMKIAKGWRYVWSGPIIGSNISGRWVEDGYREDSKILHPSSDWVRNIQDHGDGYIR